MWPLKASRPLQAAPSPEFKHVGVARTQEIEPNSLILQMGKLRPSKEQTLPKIIHLFIQQTFPEHLLCAGLCSGSQGYGSGEVPVLTKLAFQREEADNK